MLRGFPKPLQALDLVPRNATARKIHFGQVELRNGGSSLREIKEVREPIRFRGTKMTDGEEDQKKSRLHSAIPRMPPAYRFKL